MLPEWDGTERVFPSTRYEWRRVKIEPAARPHRAQRERSELDVAVGTARRARRGLPKSRTGVLVTWRGGPECWWELSYAGRTVRVTGFVALHDAMRFLLEGN